MSKRSCLVLGCGRGGTSLLAGMIARAGYYAGEKLHAATPANPKGFYEDLEINNINEALLSSQFPAGMRLRTAPWRWGWIKNGAQRWLVDLPPDARVPEPSEALRARIRAQVDHRPFCLKDPRFCYTLDAWRPDLGDAAFLCVFRDPTVTARSMVNEVRSRRYLASLRLVVTERYALDVWTSMFQHVLSRHREQGDWMFIHYNQLFEAEHVRRLEEFLGTSVDSEFADRRLDRTTPGTPSAATAEVYRELCALAGYAA